MAALEVKDLVVDYRRRAGAQVRAVSGASIDVARGEVVALVGESGCGKSTLARAAVGLVQATSGSIELDGSPVPYIGLRRRPAETVKLQMVFQDPGSSLNPRRRIGSQLLDGTKSLGARPDPGHAEDLLEQVGLGAEVARRYPNELSGGQRQRVAIARCLAADPAVIVADEALSALDPSSQAQIANLISSLASERDVGFLFISHDLAVVRHVAHRVFVMYLGRIVEMGAANEVWRRPAHPYTQALIGAHPEPDGLHQLPLSLAGDIPDPARPPSGCRLRPRCPSVFSRCCDEPTLDTVVASGREHLVACWRNGDREPSEIIRPDQVACQTVVSVGAYNADTKPIGSQLVASTTIPVASTGAHVSETETTSEPHYETLSARWRTVLSFVARRAGASVALMLGVVALIFTLVQVVPANTVVVNLGQVASQNASAVAAYKARFGLNHSLPVQYLLYLKNIITGHLGTSQQTYQPVLSTLEKTVPATLELVIPAIIISVIVSIILGMVAALYRGRLADLVIRIVSILGVSAPAFWLAFLAIYLFSFRLGWLPSGGRLSPQFNPPTSITGSYTVDSLLEGNWRLFGNALLHLILPVAILSLWAVGMLSRFVRSAVLEVIHEDYIRTARAKGLPNRVILLRHILRPALVPIITVIGLVFATLTAGTVLVERVFSWPGLGEFAAQSAQGLDVPALAGVTLFIALAYIVTNFLVDVLYVAIDPRMRAS